MNYYQFMDRADTWVENDGLFTWLSQHSVVIIVGCLLLASVLGWLVRRGED